MTLNELTISFVGVFRTPQAMIPQLSSEFCRNIFHNPELTMSGITPIGFVVKHKLQPVPMISISSDKFVIMAKTTDELFSYIESIKAQVPVYEFGSYGLNRDFEYLGVGQSAADWISSRFIKDRFRIGKNVNCSSRLNLMFDTGENEFLNIDVEPRVGIQDGLFLSVNHHNNCPMPGFPDRDRLRMLFNRSEQLIVQELKVLFEDEQ